MHVSRLCCLSLALWCGCIASVAHAAVLPTDLDAKIGAQYQPSDEDERAIWRNLARLEQGILTSKQRLRAPELDDFIRDVIERLIGRPAPELRIYVMHDASPNAAMLPNGMMLVNTGLLARVRDESQLAAVLAHEAGHYFRQHSIDLYRGDRRKSVQVSSGASALHSFDDRQGAWMLTNLAIMMSSSRFSRDLESEADAYGLKLMARGGYRPHAALAIWDQLLEERRASAAARQKRFRDVTDSTLSTHPPTRIRMVNLADTAEHLAREHALEGEPVGDDWAEIIRPYQAMLLGEQIYLNDPGASLYLLDAWAKAGWTGALRFLEGEVYRLRNAPGDAARSAAAYALATTLSDAPAEAWRGHGYALLAAGREMEAREAFNRFLAMNPLAPDAAMVRFTLSRSGIVDEPTAAGRRLTVEVSSWKRLHGSVNEARWKKVWTWNGAQLDRLSLLDGLPEGKTIVIQKPTDDQQVPVFHGHMTAQDLSSMLEVAYRRNGVTVFDIESVDPVSFLDGPGVRLRYRYASGIVIPKRGNCVMRVVGRKLYALKLEGVANPSFDAVAAEFDRLVAGAKLQ